MLRRQRLDQAGGAHDPKGHCEAEERLREAEHRRRLDRRPAREGKEQPAERLEEERGDHDRAETPPGGERPGEPGPQQAERTDRGE